MMLTFSQYINEMMHLFDSKTPVEALLNNKIVVSIKVDSAALVVQNDNGTLRFYGRNGAGEIDMVKRAGLTIYERAINYLQSTNWKNLPSGYKFFMEMFDDDLNPLIKYSTRPKNNLILLFAQNQSGTNIRPDDQIVQQAANTLNIAAPPILFSGYLTYQQKQKIQSFVDSDDRQRDFGNQNFTAFVASLFTTPDELSYLINDGMEGIVLYVGSEQDPRAFKIVDPGFTARIKAKAGYNTDYWAAIYNACWGECLDIAQDILDSPAVRNYKVQNISESDPAFISFISEVVKRFCQSDGQELLDKVEQYKESVVSKRYSGLNSQFVPSSIMSLSDEYFFVDDIFRTLLFSLMKQQNRINPKLQMDYSTKDKINQIVAGLQQRNIR